MRAPAALSMTPMVIEARNLPARVTSDILQRNKTAANARLMARDSVSTTQSFCDVRSIKERPERRRSGLSSVKRIDQNL